MKYLSNYTEEKTSKTLKENGAFFAFSNKQFNENKKEGVKYVRLYSGLIAPEENVKKILNELDKINKEGIKQDIKENSIRNIIWREFQNFECQFEMNPERALESLEDYPITKERINKEFKKYYNYCIKNDMY